MIRSRTAAALLVLQPLLAAVAARAAPDEFRPPSREELENIRWVRRPCVDFLEHLRAAREKEPVLATEAEALALANDGPEANAKILNALGRLPESEEEVDWEATCTRFMSSDPPTANPVFRTSIFDGWLVDLLYAMPFNLDWNLEVYGDLNVIKSWETSADGLIDRVVLREDLTWSDGKPFTAHDIEFTWKVIMDPRVPALGYRDVVKPLRAVTAADDRTVLYFHKDVLATNRTNIVFPPLARHVFEASYLTDPTLKTSPYHVQMNVNPVLNGPYRLVSWTPKQEIVLERREEWHRGADGVQIRDRPFFRRVRFKILPETQTTFLQLKTGGIDEAQFDTNHWVNHARGPEFDAGCVKARAEAWTYAFIGWNAMSIPLNPFFADKRVRLALAHALDHDFFHQSLLFGIPKRGRGIFHPDSWPASQDLKPLRRDLALAEKLLDEAGWKDTDGDGIRDKVVNGSKVPFRFRLSSPSSGTGPKAAELFQADLKAIGVDCAVQVLQGAAFNQEVNDRRAQAFLMAMGTGVDPDNIRNIWETSAIEGGRNSVGYSNPRVDELFEKGRREHDKAKRAAIYSEIERLIYDDHPVTVLYYQSSLWGFSKQLRGYRGSPRGWYTYAPGCFSFWRPKAK